MNPSALRGLILVAAIVIGGGLLYHGFPAGSASAPVSSHPSPSPSPSHTARATPPSPGSSPSPAVKKVTLQVLNGTADSALLVQQVARLRHAGYEICPACTGTAVAYTTTTIFYRSGHKADAETLRDHYYSGAPIKPNPPSILSKVDATVILGANTAAGAPA